MTENLEKSKDFSTTVENPKGFQGKPVLAVLFIAVIGGLIAGFVCSAIMLFTVNILIQDMSEQLQNISINCSEKINLFASVITLGDTVYYCTVEEKKKGQEYSLPLG